MRARRCRAIVQLEKLGEQQIVFRDRLVLSAALPDGQTTNLDVVVDHVTRDAERPWMMTVTCRPASRGGTS
jgi:hypothetical protein